MNLQWKIIISTCLAIAICFTMASAATESPFTRTSFDKQTSFAEAKAAAAANFRTDWTSFDRVPSDAGGPVDPIPPEITRPTVIPTRVPTPQATFPAILRPVITRWEVEEMILAPLSPDVHVENLRITLQYPKWLGILTWFVQYDLYYCPANHDADELCLGHCVQVYIDAMTGERVL